MRHDGKTFDVAEPQVVSKAEAADARRPRCDGFSRGSPFEQAVLFTRTT